MKIIPIASASYSRLATFEQCKLRAQLQYGQKIPEPERPLPEGKTEHANDRGTRIHTSAELFVQNKGPFIPEMGKFRPEFESLKKLYSRGMASLEGEWGFDRDWNPVDWRGYWVEDLEGVAVVTSTTKSLKSLPAYGQADQVIRVGKKVFAWVQTYLRIKLDAMVHLSKYEAVVIDYKSGKKFGNEVKHAEQTQSYQLAAFLKYPHLEEVTTELWYLDINEMTQVTFTRSQGLRFRRKFDERFNNMTTATEFPANANHFTCRYCWFSNRPGGTGHCTKGTW